MNGRLWLILTLSPVVVWLGSSPPPAEDVLLELRSSSSGAPIHGALVYVPGKLTVYRSDRRGEVTLPQDWSSESVHVWAKNHRLEILPPGKKGRIELTFDPGLVNPREAQMVFTRADSLRGTYGPLRSNHDLLAYDLQVRVDPATRWIGGRNRISFRMLEDGRTIQLDLYAHLDIDSILWGGESLPYRREAHAFFVDFPRELRAGERVTLDVHYAGVTRELGRFGGIAFRTDSLGNPWINTACQGIGASTWWPNKDQQPDEPQEGVILSVTVPSGLVNVSNGRLVAVEDRGDGTTTYTWRVHHPINNYSVSLNIGRYVHFADTLGGRSLDFWVLPYHLEAARRQFSQVKPMMECFEKHFGPYPFPEDGYKLVEVPYAGMEHQSAVTYGNGFTNGYLGRDWTGVGISPRFDFIIIHESAHEWFGNSVTANDVSDAWIHEGFATYMEGVYVECQWGYEDALRYLNGYKSKVRNQEPIIGPVDVNHWPTQDQYFKGALFLNTLRHVVGDDETWWALLRETALHFRHRNIWTTDIINLFNARLGQDLRPLFHQYLYYWNLPVLELEFAADSVRFRWRADVEDFAMPLKVRTPQGLRLVRPTTRWQTVSLDGVSAEDWQPATDLFYIAVERR